MKKILLSIIYFLAGIFSVSAQTLYTTTISGGINGEGSIDKFVTTTNTLTTVKSFGGPGVDGTQPGGDLMQAADGKIYGMTRDGGLRRAGIIYSFDDAASTYTKLKDFDISDGAFPIGGLIQASNGKLYGMTTGGGANNLGVIFSFDISSSLYTKLKDFNGANGKYPRGNLVQASDGKLYGVAFEGGANDLGVIFSFDPSTSTYTKLLDFDGLNGESASGNLIEVGGKLYGLTGRAGANDRGVIFSFDPSTSNYTVLKQLDSTSGFGPTGSLVQAIDGKLYGTATVDVANDNNVHVIFSFDLSSSTYTKLKVVNNTLGTLLQASDGKLYGIAGDGGPHVGKIFSFDPLTSVYTELKDSDRGFAATFIELRECTTYYRDEDGDGYGNSCISVMACAKPVGYVINKGDCDDHDSAVHASAIYYLDFDGDGYGDPSAPMAFCQSAPPAGYVKNANDCNDHKTVSNPANERVLMCHNGISGCVYASEIPIRLLQGWTLGLCPPNYNNNLSTLQYKLSNYPNPFAGTSTIKYELPQDSKVSIKVYDALGRTVATLVDENKKAGVYTVDFNAGHLSSGSMYYRIIATSKGQQFEQTNKMIQLR